MSGRRWAAIATWVVTVTAAGLAFAILVATRDTPAMTLWGFRGALEIFALVWGTVGAIVALRRPANLNGWLFCAIGLFFAAIALVTEYVIAGVLVVPGGLPHVAGLGWLLTWLWVPPLGLALVFLPLVFPSGSLLTRRWRAAVALGVVAIVSFSAAVAFLPGPIQQATFLVNPFGASRMDLETYARTVVAVPAALFLASIVVAIAALVLRFRRSPREERLQIKWFALAASIAGVIFAFHTVLSVATASPPSAFTPLAIVGIVVLAGLPTAAGMAILRYRLYDIDRIVSRTISYGVISTLLIATFLLVNLALQAVLTGVTSNTSSWAVAGSTLLAAALFTPVRQRVQRTVDRRFDRARYDAERTTAAFSERLRDEVDLATLTHELDAVVRGAIAPSTIRVWLRGEGR